MVFSSGIFLFFFLPVTLLFYKVFKSLNAKNTVLLAASLFFYAFGEPVYVFLLLLSILLNWIFGLLVASGKNRKIWLVVSIAFNLSLLFVFKYLGFVCKNLSLLLNRNIDVNIALPIGISFFTFQAMSYVIDVYRGQGEAQKKIRNVALYISLFPQLIAGPIVRYETVATQLSYRTVDPEKVTSGVRRFMSGFVKKVVACVNNVDKVLDGCEVVSCAVEVDVDSAAGVYEGASVSKLSDDLLQGVDILLVSQDRGNQFAFVKVCRPGDLAVNLLLRGNARIEHYFPNSAVWRGDVVGVVSASDVANRSVQLLGDNLCRFVSGDACELDFCSESCVYHSKKLLFSLFCFALFSLSVCVY